NFTEPLVETAFKSLRHSCRSELTRQGISLEPYFRQSRKRMARPRSTRAFPACRHADGTISSSSVLDVRRMASEDSDQLSSGLLAIHRLSDLRDVRMSCVDHLDAAGELLEVPLRTPRVHEDARRLGRLA